MNSKRVSPQPIIENLEHIGDPLKQSTFTTKSYLNESIVGADLDLEYALKFLYSNNGNSATALSYRREIERLLQWAWLEL